MGSGEKPSNNLSSSGIRGGGRRTAQHSNMATVKLEERTRINHELKKLGFGGIEDRNLFAQIATLYKTHESFRGLLMSTQPDQRRIAYEAIRPHLCFVAKPLDVYEREIHEKAEREQWDVIHEDNPHWPQPFKVSEIETDEYKLQKLAAGSHRNLRAGEIQGRAGNGVPHLSVAEHFPAAKRRKR